MKTILCIRVEEYDPAKHQPFNAANPDPNKALVCFVCFRAKLTPSADDLIMKREKSQE